MKREFQFLLYIPGTQMTSIFEGQPPKTRPFQTQTRVIKGFPGKYIHLSIGSAPLELSRTTLSPLLDWGCRSCETDRYFGKRRSIRVGVLGGVNQKSKKNTEFGAKPGPNPQKWRKNTLPETNRKKKKLKICRNCLKRVKSYPMVSFGHKMSQGSNIEDFLLKIKGPRNKESAECSKWILNGAK